MTLSKHSPLLFLLCLYLLAVGFRCWYTSGGLFGFHYEPIRDALVAKSIYTHGDLKILGPPAGNSGESIYHGVLYYYLLGLLYVSLNNNPQLVVWALGAISSLAIIPAYLFSFDATAKKNIGLLTAALLAFSLTHAEMGTHLFNISLATASIPFAYYFAWKVFLKNQSHLFIPLAIAIGITAQAGIYLIYILIPIIILWYLRFKETGKITLGSAANTTLAMATLGLFMSTMVLAQYKLYLAGVFSLGDIGTANQSHLSFWANLKESTSLFFTRMSEMHLSPIRLVNLAGLGLAGYSIRKELYSDWGRVLFLWLGSHLGLLILMPRITYYMTVGMPLPILFVFAVFIHKIGTKSKMWSLVGLILVVVYLTSNVLVAQEQRTKRMGQLYSGTYLDEQKALVDQTYWWANGQSFSISALTSPYGVATTWGYMFDWYGKSKYGYKPYWFGPDQTGLPGEGLLERVDDVENTHVVIYEPYFGNEDVMKKSFEELQQVYAPKLIEAKLIGDQKLELRTQEFTSSGR